MVTRSSWRLVVVAVFTAFALAYLRDPAWLQDVSSGFRGWERDASGTRFRWTGGHASLFVPADARAITIPLRSPASADDPRLVLVTISLDGRPAERLALGEPEWHQTRIPLPPRGSRHLRRVDIQSFPTRAGNKGVEVGEVGIEW